MMMKMVDQPVSPEAEEKALLNRIVEEKTWQLFADKVKLL
eukprot:CAMPEP_0118708504 /NCGR_PEP_ID=MMETSP0800-20121206/21938_1 /TAXON_ID=210618 ORGANISM="Striatella unipunctata, Strain CCMP2910" /NCGR_SAMPLE_ID=MMETSP0800 /ASSEMBLY_ACC=CAM_ASM_000638 /LENGTH=39 /DNA_ID= /DNA_START= /DNA_END= /DNA_ORIENTATION=